MSTPKPRAACSAEDAPVLAIVAPVVEEPVVDEPVVDEPVVDEPVVDEPVVEEPVVDEPVVDEPVVDEPVAAAAVVLLPLAAAVELLPAAVVSAVELAVVAAELAVVSAPPAPATTLMSTMEEAEVVQLTVRPSTEMLPIVPLAVPVTSETPIDFAPAVLATTVADPEYTKLPG